MSKTVIRGGAQITGALPSGTGDNLLTTDGTSLGSISPIDVSTFISTTLPSTQILVGNGSNVATAVAMTGDGSISNAGVFAIGTGVIVNADVNASAGITLSKLAATTASRLLVSDGSGFITPSAVTATEAGYLSGVTSAIQTQLGTKVTNSFTASRALISNGSGNVAVSSVTSTELGYLSGVTSAVQTQLNTKLAATITGAAQGDIIYYNGSGWVNLAKGTIGQVLQSTAGSIQWASGASNGLPVGGTVGQYLKKASAADYDAGWDNLVLSEITDVTATYTEVNKLSGVTTTTTQLNFLNTTAGDVQSQLDAKLGLSLNQNYMFVGNASNVVSTLAPGTNGYVLTSVSGVPTWVSPGVGGTVTSVAASGGTTGMSFTGSPITTSGTLTLTGTLAIANGGTGLTALGTANQILRVNAGATALEYYSPVGFADPMTTRGDLIYRNSSNVTARLPVGTATYVLTSDGTDVSWAAPSSSFTLTDGNGTTANGTAVDLGGTLTGNTTIAGTAGEDFTIRLYGEDANQKLRLESYDDVAISSIQLDITPAIFKLNDTGLGFTPFGYNQGGGIELNFFSGNASQDLFKRGASGFLERIPVGSNGDVFSVTAGSVGWAAPSVKLSSLLAATATNSIDNLNFKQTWNFSTLADDVALELISTSTLANSNSQIGMRVVLNGANANSLQTTTAFAAINQHTGTTSTNIAGIFTASGGATANYSLELTGDIRLVNTNTLIGATNGIGRTLTFLPGTDVVGINVGSTTADPTSPSNGGIYYNSTANELRARINGAWVALGAGGGGGYTNLTQFVAQTNWRGFYSNGSGDVTELAFGALGTVYKSAGASAAPIWEYANPVITRSFTANNYTLVAADHDQIIQLDNGATAGTITLPTGLPTSFSCTVVNRGTGILTLTTSGSTLTSDGTTLEVRYTGVNIYHGGSDVFTAMGSLGAALTLGNITGTLDVDSGGTNITSYAIGDLIQATGATTLSKLASVSAGSFLRTGGVTTASAWSTVKLPDTMSALGIWVANSTNTVVNLTAAANQSIRVNSGGTAWEAYTPTGGGIGGSTGATDNSVLRADGVGGSTLQNSALFVDDSGNITLGTASIAGLRNITVQSSDTNADLVLNPKGAGAAYAILTTGQFGATNSAYTESLLYSPGSKEWLLTAVNPSTTPLTHRAAYGNATNTAGGSILIAGGGGYVVSGNNNGGHVYLMYGAKANSGLDGNIGLLTSSVANWQAMERGIFMADALTAPTGNPSNGLFKWVDGSTKQAKVRDEDGNVYDETPRNGTITIEFYNGGSDLTTGIKDTAVQIPYGGTVVGWEIASYNSSNTLTSTTAEVEVLSDTFANLPLTGADDITGTDSPTLTAASTASDNTISWSTLVAGNYVQGEIVSIGAGIAKIVLTIKVKRTS